MLAVRQRAACIARRARPTTVTKSPRQATRSYASDHGHGDHHHHAPQVEESPGLALYLPLAAIGFSMLVYSIAPKEGEESKLASWIDGFRAESQQTWEQRNTLRTNILDQAAADRHTFSTLKASGFELTTPELINSGCPNNVPAGHYVNLDKVVAHYQQQHLEDEERKAKKLAEAKKA